MKLPCRLAVLPLMIPPLLAACSTEEHAPASPPQAQMPQKKAMDTAPAGYQGMQVTGGGTISGHVSYAGKETDTMVTITKDVQTCCPTCQDSKRPANTLVVQDGKLRNAVVYIDGITKGKEFTPKDAEIDNVGCRFEPHVGIAYKGAELATKNSDALLHNTHLYLMEKNRDLVNIALPQQGQVVKKTMKKDGPVSVKCDAHEWMQGYIFVATHPYAVVTGDDGAFELTDVPPGEYTVKVWHERLGEQEQKVTIAASGAATLDFSFN